MGSRLRTEIPGGDAHGSSNLWQPPELDGDKRMGCGLLGTGFKGTLARQIEGDPSVLPEKLATVTLARSFSGPMTRTGLPAWASGLGGRKVEEAGSGPGRNLQRAVRQGRFRIPISRRAKGRTDERREKTQGSHVDLSWERLRRAWEKQVGLSETIGKGSGGQGDADYTLYLIGTRGTAQGNPAPKSTVTLPFQRRKGT